MMNYRFVVSYARADLVSAKIIKNKLKAVRQQTEEKPSTGENYVWMDVQAGAGSDFTRQIKEEIQRCHFFVPIITPNSSISLWVQQEIGYALACNIPVVPIVIGVPPKKSGMIFGINSIVIKKQLKPNQIQKKLQNQNWDKLLKKQLNPNQIQKKLQNQKWEELLLESQEKKSAIFQCDTDDNTKSELLIKSANAVNGKYKNLNVMQMSTLTSFSLPTEPEDVNWQKVKKKKHRPYWFVPDERKALEKLVKNGGCKLIIDPCYSQKGYMPETNIAKLLTLSQFFMENLKKGNIEVVVKQLDTSESELIIEDHWMAHSAAVGTMITERETISTWHAPTVRRYAQRFINGFQKLYGLQEEYLNGKDSVEYAVDRINCRIKKLNGCTSVPDRCDNCKFQPNHH